MNYNIILINIVLYTLLTIWTKQINKLLQLYLGT